MIKIWRKIINFSIPKFICKIKISFYIHKMHYRFLTPRESYLLMGFSEEDYENIKATNFITKEIAYRQAGNSIVVNVLIAVFNYIYQLEKRKTSLD